MDEQHSTPKNFDEDIKNIESIPIIVNLLDVICRTTGMGFAAVARVTEDRWIACSVHDNIAFGMKAGDELQIKTTICDEVRHDKRAVVIDNVAEDPQFCDHTTPAMYGFQSYISVPITRKDGTFFGTLCAIDPRPNVLNTPAIIGMFELFADLIAFHLHAVEQLGSVESILKKERAVNKINEENELRLGIIIDASELGTWELNLKTNGIQYSDRYIEIFGYQKGTQVTRTVLRQQLHPDDVILHEKAFEEAYITGLLHSEVRIICPDGSIHWIENHGKVFLDAAGSPSKMIGTVRDVTEEKNYRQELEESEQKFRLLADSMPQHIWTSDTEGNLNYYNKSVFDFAGMDLETINKNGWLDIVHPEDRERNVKSWIESITTGKDFLFEHRFLRHDGQYRWQLSRAIPQKDTEGNIRMWVGTSTDIQDQKDFSNKLERKVQERTRELEQKNITLEKLNKELESFAYISSHDLQEPLRKIQTFSNIIAEKELDKLSDTGKDYFKRMRNAAERMQILINDLLSYSRTNNQKLKFEKVDLNVILEEVKADISEELAQHNVVIDARNLFPIKIIPFQFRQILYNLISNSIKFSKSGQPPHIIIDCEIISGSEIPNATVNQELQYCHLRISDNGIGFEKAYNEKIFELFQRLHGRETYSGTGIGLAIVKKIVDNHHGIIAAEGENGGATFDIYIPAV